MIYYHDVTGRVRPLLLSGAAFPVLHLLHFTAVFTRPRLYKYIFSFRIYILVIVLGYKTVCYWHCKPGEKKIVKIVL